MHGRLQVFPKCAVENAVVHWSPALKYLTALHFGHIVDVQAIELISNRCDGEE